MNIEFTIISQGSNSSYQSTSQMVINNSEQWNDLWQQHTSNTEPPPPILRVDFTRHSVVAVFAGEKPTGGYSVKILSAKTSGSPAQERSLITITVQHRQPEAGDFAKEALTYPYQMIRIPKIDGKVVFKHV